jgi:hypothetical protein
MSEIDQSAAKVDEADDLAHLLADLASLKRAVSETYKTVEARLVAEAGNRKFEVAGLGLVEIKRATKYTQWKNDELWRVVAARALDERLMDPETGELLERESETISRVLRACVSPSWLLTGLRNRGIQVDEFANVEENGYSVRLPKREGF